MKKFYEIKQENLKNVKENERNVKKILTKL